MPISRRTLAALFILSLSASACIFYPKMAKHDDAECTTIIKPMKLAHTGPGSIGGDPRGWIVAAGIATTTMIVSGSVVVSDNTIYWLEREVRCPNNKPVVETAGAPSEDHTQ